MKLKGLGSVLRKLNKQVGKFELGSRKGLQESGRFLKEDARAITPKDTGDLRDSLFFRTAVTPDGVTLRVGASAEHASIVHEMPKTNNFTTAGTGPKFITRAINKNRRKILKTVRKSMKARFG